MTRKITLDARAFMPRKAHKVRFFFIGNAMIARLDTGTRLIHLLLVAVGFNFILCFVTLFGLWAGHHAK